MENCRTAQETIIEGGRTLLQGWTARDEAGRKVSSSGRCFPGQGLCLAPPSGCLRWQALSQGRDRGCIGIEALEVRQWRYWNSFSSF